VLVAQVVTPDQLLARTRPSGAVLIQVEVVTLGKGWERRSERKLDGIADYLTEAMTGR
jgi:hypothetical protein